MQNRQVCGKNTESPAVKDTAMATAINMLVDSTPIIKKKCSNYQKGKKTNRFGCLFSKFVTVSVGL